MNVEPFLLERFYARHEFTARYLLSSSDCEALALSELLAMADDEAARLWEQLRLGYTESPGHPLLREEIARSYAGLRAADVLVAVPEECIFLLMHALLRPGDHVVGTFPAYQSLYSVARSIGCEFSAWEPDEGRGWHFDPDRLRALLRPTTRLLVVNFPHNPTGYLPPPAEFEAVLSLAREHGIHLFSDEMYRLLELAPGTTLPAACELYERAVSLSGTSKVYGLPGLRIGWLATRDQRLLGRVAELKDYTTICSSAPSEILAIIALRGRSDIIRRQAARVQRNLGVLQHFFAKRSHQFAWNLPLGGTICLPRMTMVEDTSAFCEELVEETGIMLVPSEQFHFGHRHVRIGLGRENFPEVLARLGDHLQDRFGQ
jgi:aspartate/methionine/tyrosine aminotransferase